MAMFYLVYLTPYMVPEGKHERLGVPSWMLVIQSINNLVNLFLDRKWSCPLIVQFIAWPICLNIASKKPYFIANLQRRLFFPRLISRCFVTVLSLLELKFMASWSCNNRVAKSSAVGLSILEGSRRSNLG
jgi:hypothetical protein